MATIDWNNPPPDKSLDFLIKPMSAAERAAALRTSASPGERPQPASAAVPPPNTINLDPKMYRQNEYTDPKDKGQQSDLGLAISNARVALGGTRSLYSQDTSATPASRELLSMNPAQQGGINFPNMEAANALDTYHAQALQIMGQTFDQASGAATADKMNYNAKIVEGAKGEAIGKGASLVTAASNKYGSGYAVTPLAAPTPNQLAFGPSGKASVALKGVSPDAVSPAAAPKMALAAVSPQVDTTQGASAFMGGKQPASAGAAPAAAPKMALAAVSPQVDTTQGASAFMGGKQPASAGAAPATAIPKWNPYTFSRSVLNAPATSVGGQPTQSTQSKNNAAQRWEGDPAKFISAKATHALLEPDNINAKGSLSTPSDPGLDQKVSSALTARYGKGMEPNAPVTVTLGGKTVGIDRRNPVKSLRQFIYEAKQAGDNKAIDDYSKFMGTLNLNS